MFREVLLDRLSFLTDGTNAGFPAVLIIILAVGNRRKIIKNIGSLLCFW